MKEQKMEDKKEYSIYCMYGRGKPFNICTFSSFEEAMLRLNEIVQHEEERHKIYYVDNDFFENKYELGVQEKYFSLIERTVSNWKKTSLEKNVTKKQNKETQNKVLAFRKYV